MSDGAPRDSAVFGGLDAFDEHAVDPDAMDRMLLNLAAASDPPDWQLEPLAPDLLSPSNAAYSLPLHYIDTTTPTAPTPSNTPAHPLSSLPSASTALSALQLQSSLPSTSPQGQPTSSPSSDNDMQVSLDGQVANSKSPPIQINTPQQSQSQQLQSAQNLDASASQSSLPPPSGTPRKRPAPSGSSRSPQQPNRSPAISGSSAKPRVPTAVCPLCGKSISTNGANFRRHEQACRRQRAERVSGSRPPTSPAITGAASASNTNPNTMPSAPSSVPFPSVEHPGSLGSAGLSRRDSDLFEVVRRLETSISTLDVSARLCLRDALLSLSNKASNPHIAPTPEQEAMNRAAEYLVLRMLFLSGQQVLHTPPGTAGAPYPTDEQTQSVAPAGASRSQAGSRDVAGGSGGGASEADDGTVAASTGTAGAALAKQEDTMEESPMRPIAKTEDKIAGGT